MIHFTNILFSTIYGKCELDCIVRPPHSGTGPLISVLLRPFSCSNSFRDVNLTLLDAYVIRFCVDNEIFQSWVKTSDGKDLLRVFWAPENISVFATDVFDSVY